MTRKKQVIGGPLEIGGRVLSLSRAITSAMNIRTGGTNGGDAVNALPNAGNRGRPATKPSPWGRFH